MQGGNFLQAHLTRLRRKPTFIAKLDELREAFVHRLLERYVQPGGCLLIAEYLGRSTGAPGIRIDEELKQWGFVLETVKSSHLEHDTLGQTRVAVIKKLACI